MSFQNLNLKTHRKNLSESCGPFLFNICGISQILSTGGGLQAS